VTADRRVLVVGAGSTAGKLTDALLAIAVRDVVTTISARPLAELLPEDALPHRLMRRLRIWRYSTGAFKLDYALSRPVPWTAAEARLASVVHVGGELRDLSAAAAAEAAQRGEMPDRPALAGEQHTLHDHTRAPEGKHTLYCYAMFRLPTRTWRRCAKPSWSASPRLLAGVLVRTIRGPRQTEAENPSLVGGDLGGGNLGSSTRSSRLGPGPSCAATVRRCAVSTSAKPPSIPAARLRAWGAAQPRAPESWARETASAGAPRNGSPWPNSSVPASTAARIGNDCRVRAGSPLRASGISRGPRAWVSTL